MVFPSVVLLHVHVVHQRRVWLGVRSAGDTKLALMLLYALLYLSSPPFLVDTRTEDK